MQKNDRVAKLGKAVDDMYANIYLWHQLDSVKQDKLKQLFKKMSGQLGISEFMEKPKQFKKGTEDF